MKPSTRLATLPPRRRASPPRLGFLGVGWIGRHRLEAVARGGLAEIAAIGDPDAACRDAAAAVAPDAQCVDSLDALLGLGLDGVVIATPSALHAEQAIAALEAGLAVFCQKPLGRTAPETAAVVAAARAADRLLGVDMSYRRTAAMQRIRDRIAQDALGDVFAANLVFHNAYGPDKPWFTDPALAGGGCLMDLGIHLVDLGLWCLGHPPVEAVSARLLRKGAPATGIEDFAVARLDTAGGGVINIACSWWLPAGGDAVIAAEFYGTRGGAAMRNVDGSFYDFVADAFNGTAAERLASPPDEWGGRTIIAWADALAAGRGFDPEVERLVDVAAVLDRIYGR